MVQDLIVVYFSIYYKVRYLSCGTLSWLWAGLPSNRGLIAGREKRHFSEVREKTNNMQQLDVYFQQFLNMFRASLCPSSGDGHNDVRNMLRNCWK